MNRPRPRCLGVVAASMLAGCGTAAHADQQHSAARTSDVQATSAARTGESAAPSGDSCTIYRQGSDVRVTFSGASAQPACRQAAQRWSGVSAYWATGSPPPEYQLAETCALQAPGYSVSVIVEDSGSDGTTVCGVLTNSGWTPDPSAPAIGPVEDAATKQSRVDRAAQAVTDDVAGLDRSTSQARSGWRGVRADLQGLRSDERAILKDAAAATASHCDTWPDAADSPEIGAGYLLQDLRDLHSAAAQTQVDETNYQQAARGATPAQPPPNPAVVLAAIATASSTVQTLIPKVRAARDAANAVVDQENEAADATGC